MQGSDPEAKSIVIDSHMDTVMQGGVYDGMLGVTGAKYSTPCDPRLIKLIDDVCTEKGISHIIMPSGAGHDANSMAHEGVPIGMIFVPSVKGISHQGDEYTKPEHIDLGADVLYQTVLKLDENGV